MHSVREELSLFDCLAIFLAFCLSMNTISAIRTENAMPQLIASADRLTVLKQQPVPRMPRFLLLVRTPEIAAAARLFEVSVKAAMARLASSLLLSLHWLSWLMFFCSWARASRTASICFFSSSRAWARLSASESASLFRRLIALSTKPSAIQRFW